MDMYTIVIEVNGEIFKKVWMAQSKFDAICQVIEMYADIYRVEEGLITLISAKQGDQRDPQRQPARRIEANRGLPPVPPLWGVNPNIWLADNNE